MNAKTVQCSVSVARTKILAHSWCCTGASIQTASAAYLCGKMPTDGGLTRIDIAHRNHPEQRLPGRQVMLPSNGRGLGTRKKRDTSA